MPTGRSRGAVDGTIMIEAYLAYCNRWAVGERVVAFTKPMCRRLR